MRSRCGDGTSPSQKDTGRTGRLYQNEQGARAALLAKRVFVENRSSEIQSPTGRRCLRPALQYPVQHRRAHERRLYHRLPQSCSAIRVSQMRTLWTERMYRKCRASWATALWPRKIKRKAGKLTTPTRRETCCGGSAPILLHGHLRESRRTTACVRQIVEMNCSVSLTLTPLPKRCSALQRPKV